MRRMHTQVKCVTLSASLTIELLDMVHEESEQARHGEVVLGVLLELEDLLDRQVEGQHHRGDLTSLKESTAKRKNTEWLSEK